MLANNTYTGMHVLGGIVCLYMGEVYTILAQTFQGLTEPVESISE